MNGSIVWSDAVVIPDAQACSYGGERYEVIRFMQKPADQLDKLEPAERQYADQLAAEIRRDVRPFRKRRAGVREELQVLRNHARMARNAPTRPNGWTPHCSCVCWRSKKG